MKEYFILSTDPLKSPDISKFIKLVNVHLRMGWECQGGIHTGKDGEFYQAIVKEIKTTGA